jgi:hypothetical protein
MLLVSIPGYHTIVVRTFGYTTIAIQIFRYDTYSILKYGAILRKGAQRTSWGWSPSDPISLEYDLNTQCGYYTWHVTPAVCWTPCRIICRLCSIQYDGLVFRIWSVRTSRGFARFDDLWYTFGTTLLDYTPTRPHQLLRSYSKGIGSEGLWPQLVRCAPFPSIAPYFRILYVSYLKIQMAIVAYPKVRTTIVGYPVIETSNVFLSEDKE